MKSHKSFLLGFLILFCFNLNSQNYIEVTDWGWGGGYTGTSPAFYDIDNDGLFDLLVGLNDGKLLHYEQSSVGAFQFEFIDSYFDSISVGSSASPTFYDIDNDGLVDLFIGEYYGNINHYEQASTNSYNFILQTTDFNNINVGYNSKPAFADVLGNGKVTLAIGKNNGGTSHYEQVSPGSLTFEPNTSTLATIDVGYYSAPAFTDLNNDGLLDLIIGENEGNLNHLIQENFTSTTFQVQSQEFNGINYSSSKFSPAIVDLNNDGLQEIFIGTSEGAIYLYTQEIGNGFHYSLQNTDILNLAPGNHLRPTVADIDNDGLLDLLVGEDDGNINHYEQVDTNGTNFYLISGNFNNIDVGNRATPTICDIDNDGLYDLVIGEADGFLNHYEQATVNSLIFNLVSTGFAGIDVGNYSAPLFYDVDSDGLLNLFVGTQNQSVRHYVQDSINSYNFNLITSAFSGISSYYNVPSIPAIYDLDNDSLLDFVVASNNYIKRYEQEAINSLVFDNQPVIPGIFEAGNSGSFITDLDNDNLPDIIVGLSGSMQHYELNTTSFECAEGDDLLYYDAGFQSKPAVYDIDGDGLLDMLIGQEGSYLLLYEQKESGSLRFELRDRRYLYTGTEGAPTFTDLDGDSLVDIVLGRYDGTFRWLEQDSLNAYSFTTNYGAFSGIDVGYNSYPSFTDLDSDGLLDMIAGASSGQLFHYEQSAVDPGAFSEVIGTFNGVDVGAYSAPSITDLDNDGLVDLIIGEYYGNEYHLEQSAPSSLLFNQLSTNWILDWLQNSTLCFADINGNNVQDLIIGSEYGGLKLRLQDTIGSLALAETPISCYGNADASLTAIISGGMPPYSYSWSNGLATKTLPSLTAGTYSVTVTDANSNTYTGNHIISEPSEVIVASSITNTLDQYSSNGAIEISVSGGTPPYSYLWDNGETNTVIFNLDEGYYTVTISDANNCSSEYTFEITLANPVGPFTQTTDNHSIMIPNNIPATINGTQLSTGDYIGVFYDDGNGGLACGGYLEYSGITSWMITWGADAGQQNGFASNEEFKWKIWQASGNVEYEAIPVYNSAYQNEGNFVANGLSGLSSLMAVTPIEIVSQITHNSCNDDMLGEILVSASGGIPPYSFSWSTGDTTESISGVEAGLHGIIITDDYGQYFFSNFEINEPDMVEVSASIMDVATVMEQSGAIDISVSGGVEPYDFVWDNGYTTEDIDNIGYGNYTLTITDANLCVNEFTFTINISNGEGWTYSVNPESHSIFLPSNIPLTVLNTQIEPGDMIGLFYPTASGSIACGGFVEWTGVPNLIVAYGTDPGKENGFDTGDEFIWKIRKTSSQIEYNCQATYSTIYPNQEYFTPNGFSGLSQLISLTPFEASGQTSDLSCFESGDGTIDLTVTGGFLPYTFAWSNGSTTEDISNLAAGVYDVTITDSNFQIINQSYTLNQPEIVVTIDSVINSLQFGSTGSIYLSVTGGIPPYSFYWDNGETTEDITNQSPGNYTLSIIDSTQCLLLTQVEIPPIYTLPPSWEYSFTSTNHTILINEPMMTGSVTIDGIPINIGDYIGVFYDSLGTLMCAGYSEYTGAIGSVTAWGADIGLDGFAVGEDFKWKIWNATTGNICDAEASYIQPPMFPNAGTFVSNGMSGLHSLEGTSPAMFSTQTMIFAADWNMFSFYVDPIFANIDSVLAPIISNVIIMKDMYGGIYWPAYQINFVDTFTIGLGYQISMANHDTLEVVGTLLVPETTPINMPSGWGILGYIRNSPAPVDVMLSPYLNELIIIKNDIGNMYWPQFSVNLIGDMVPGEGYLINLNSAQSITYPPNSETFSKSYTHNLPNKRFVEHKRTDNNMTIGIPLSAWESLPNIGDEIGVFSSNGELVGAGVFDGGNLAITAWGKDFSTDEKDGLHEGECFSLRVFNNQEQKIIVDSWARGNDLFGEHKISVVGKLSISEQADQIRLFQNNPNPFSTNTQISFYLPIEENIELSIFNLLGEKVVELYRGTATEGKHTIEFTNTKLESGTYYYRLSSRNHTSNLKMSIVR